MNRAQLGCGFLAAMAIAGIAIPVSAAGSNYFHHSDVTFTVKDKGRVCDSGNSSCYYLIYTDKGTFKDSDSLMNGKFNSSDVYGSITVGKTYNATVYGWRNGFLSMYKNIVDIHPTN